MIPSSKHPITILTEGYLGTSHAKTATGIIRYGDWTISSIIDSSKQGKTLLEVTGISHSAPVVANLTQALNLSPRPQSLILGIAPVGGGLPEAWRNIIKEAISNGLNIISGLHLFLNEDTELKQLSEQHGVILWDVRDPELYPASAARSVAAQKPRPQGTKVITLVGSDCNIGKMCTALELDREAKKQGLNSAFVATGQTGIMISGNGVPLDRVIIDFAAGAMENAIWEAIERNALTSMSSSSDEHNTAVGKFQRGLIFVEGQGSLIHPGYSGVTLSLLHGSNPDGMILCHKPDRIKVYNQYDITIPSLAKLIEIYENAVTWITNDGKASAKVVGIALNTSAYSDDEALKLVKQAQSETGLPATDPIRYGVAELMKYIK